MLKYYFKSKKITLPVKILDKYIEKVNFAITDLQAKIKIKEKQLELERLKKEKEKLEKNNQNKKEQMMFLYMKLDIKKQ